jgi:hypothetical protein
MKCPHCEYKLTTSEKENKTKCPFCGKLLVTDAKVDIYTGCNRPNRQDNPLVRKSTLQDNNDIQPSIDIMQESIQAKEVKRETKSNKGKYKLFSLILLVFIAVFCVAIFIKLRIANNLALSQITAATASLDNYLNNLADQARQNGELIARQPELIEAIYRYEANKEALSDEEAEALSEALAARDFEAISMVLTDEDYAIIYEVLNDFLPGFDFVSVTGADGIALARTDNGERVYPLPKNGYDLKANPDVRQVMATGIGVDAMTFMVDNTVFCITALCPILDEGRVLGVVSCLYDLSDNKKFIKYKAQTGCEAVVFLGLEQFSTTIVDENGEHNIRIVPSDEIIEAIFERYEDSYIGFMDIADRTYGVCFSPVVWHDDIIGMLFSGIDANLVSSGQ